MAYQVGQEFNQFFPREIRQDGTGEKVLNHLGRHELHDYFSCSRTDHPNVAELIASKTNCINEHELLNFLHVREDPTRAGYYVATSAPEFGTHSAGQLVGILAPPDLNPDLVGVEHLTHLDTFPTIPEHQAPPPNHNGHYRDPVFLSDNLWDLGPVEVRPRSTPPATRQSLPAIEEQVFAQTGVDPEALRGWLGSRNLALMVVRNATTRDEADRQQPFNLRVPGGTEAVGAAGTVYKISRFQLYQADLVRGYANQQGRRALPRLLSESRALAANPARPGGLPPTGFEIAFNGSVAVFVPARWALIWHTVSSASESVVKECYWIMLQPSEIRVCDGCHGANTTTQSGQPPAANSPAALPSLLEFWWILFTDGFESEDTTRRSSGRADESSPSGAGP